MEDEPQVFVPHGDHVWLPATVVRVIGGKELEYRVESETATDFKLSASTTYKLDLDTVPESPHERGLFMGKLPLQNTEAEIAEVNSSNGQRQRSGSGSWLHEQQQHPHQGIDDMAKLPFLNEPAILFNLRGRFLKASLPYTQTAEIVLAVNPYRWLNELYTEEVQKEYLIYQRKNLPPHIYGTSAAAFNSMKEDRMHQSILVSGESGAGKTETVKLLLRHLAFMASGNAASGTEEDKHDIVHRIVDANPVLESFGNAKTVRNDNSSRFGKFIELQFQSSAQQRGAALQLVGSRSRTYLLEKSRVVHQDEGERSFHVFYQLLASPDSALLQRLGLSSQGLFGLSTREVGSFAYLENGRGVIEEDTDGTFDTRGFEGTLHTLLDLIGLVPEEIEQLWQVLAAVLHLGQVTFEPNVDAQSNDGSHVTDMELVAPCSEFFGCTPEAMARACTSRTMHIKAGAGDETYELKLSVDEAAVCRDALAKDTYAKVFDWIVMRLNASLAEKAAGGSSGGDGAGSKRATYTMGLLDIFGFECFAVNRFEQLCINLANEKLQQKFCMDVFRSVQEEYDEEGLEWSSVDFKDNAPTLELLEGHMGVLSVLNEECMRPKGSDAGFCSKLLTARSDHPNLERPKRGRAKNTGGGSSEGDGFTVIHYAGNVTYSTSGFLDKNRDKLQEQLKNVMQASTNPLIQTLFAEAESGTTFGSGGASGVSPPRRSKERRRGSVVADTVSIKFRGQLNDLMGRIQATSVQYVRCIKPNTICSPAKFETALVAEQLRSAGVLDAIRISRAAYPNRLPHATVLNRFKKLVHTHANYTKHTDSNSNASSVGGVAAKRPRAPRSSSSPSPPPILTGAASPPTTPPSTTTTVPSASSSPAELAETCGTHMVDPGEECVAVLEALLLNDPLNDPALHAMNGNDLAKHGTKVGTSHPRHLYQVGTTRVYFAAGVLERLEVLRMEAVAVAARLVQSQVRRQLCYRRYTAQRACAVRIQAIARSRVAISSFQKARRSAIVLQALVRRVVTKKGLLEARRRLAATRIQTWTRKLRHRRRYLRLRWAVLIIQGGSKMKVAFGVVKQLRESATMKRRLEELEQSLAEAEARAEDLATELARERAMRVAAERMLADEKAVSAQEKALRVAAQEALEMEQAVAGQERSQRIAAEEGLRLHEEALAEQRAESEKMRMEGARDQKRLAKLDRLDQYTDYLRTRFSLFGSNGSKREASTPLSAEDEDEDENSYCMSVSNASSTDLASNAEDTQTEAAEAAAAVKREQQRSTTSLPPRLADQDPFDRRDESEEHSMEVEPMIAYPDGSTLWEIIIKQRLAVEFELLLADAQPKIKSIVHVSGGGRVYGNYDDELQAGDEVLEVNGQNVPPGTTPAQMEQVFVKAMPVSDQPFSVEVLVFRPSSAAGRDRALAERGLAPKSGVLSYNPCLA